MNKENEMPPESAVDIGDGHKIVFAEYGGDTAGIHEYHRKPDGAWCSGWVCFKGSTWERQFTAEPVTSWDVIQREPLTLTPSISCRRCGNHGFITNGRWVKA